VASAWSCSKRAEGAEGAMNVELVTTVARVAKTKGDK